MRTAIATLACLLISASPLTAAEAERFVQQIKLESGQTAVVAEGDFEPRSMGSFSVRLYSGENPDAPVDGFLAGIIHKRDGGVEKVVLADVVGDGRDEIVVIIRCVGTGSYLSAHAIAVVTNGLVLRASVTDLARDADPVSALKEANRR